MKIERTKNAARNVCFGVILKIYQIIVPFIMRTVMIYFMGMEYLGLNSLFTSILQVLNLAELGVGSAMIFSMYKPIANDDCTTICALMKLYRLYYRIIGLVIAVIGSLITPFVPRLIHESVPDSLNIYILYLLNLSATVLSYWLFAYKNSILMAHQRDDVISKVTIVTNTLQYIIQIVVLAVFRDYYLYIIILLVGQAITNIITAIAASKLYPNYNPEGILEKSSVKEINKRIMDLFTAKLGGTIVNSADTIVISAFLGLTQLAMYQNYYFVMTAVVGVISVIFQSVTAGIGNSLVTETTEKNYNDYKKLTFFITWISTVCVCCFATMYQPFMKIWVGETYMFDYKIVVLFCVYFYLYILQKLACVYKDAAGIWHEDRFRPLIGAIVNLTLNLLMVNNWGMYAILLSTIISYIIVAMPWLIHNLFSLVFKCSCKDYIFGIIFDLLIAFVISCICVWVCGYLKFDGLFYLIICGAVSFLIGNFLLFIFKKNSILFVSMIEIINRITKKRFDFLLNRLL